MRAARSQQPYYSEILRITDAFSLFEAGYQFIVRQQKPPVCARFAHLDWGYERFSLSEAGSCD